MLGSLQKSPPKHTASQFEEQRERLPEGAMDGYGISQRPSWQAKTWWWTSRRCRCRDCRDIRFLDKPTLPQGQLLLKIDHWRTSLDGDIQCLIRNGRCRINIKRTKSRAKNGPQSWSLGKLGPLSLKKLDPYPSVPQTYSPWNQLNQPLISSRTELWLRHPRVPFFPETEPPISTDQDV